MESITLDELLDVFSRLPYGSFDRGQRFATPVIRLADAGPIEDLADVTFHDVHAPIVVEFRYTCPSFSPHPGRWRLLDPIKVETPIDHKNFRNVLIAAERTRVDPGSIPLIEWTLPEDTFERSAIAVAYLRFLRQSVFGPNGSHEWLVPIPNSPHVVPMDAKVMLRYARDSFKFDLIREKAD